MHFVLKNNKKLKLKDEHKEIYKKIELSLVSHPHRIPLISPLFKQYSNQLLEIIFNILILLLYHTKIIFKLENKHKLPHLFEKKLNKTNLLFVLPIRVIIFTLVHPLNLKKKYKNTSVIQMLSRNYLKTHSMKF